MSWWQLSNKLMDYPPGKPIWNKRKNIWLVTSKQYTQIDPNTLVSVQRLTATCRKTDFYYAIYGNYMGGNIDQLTAQNEYLITDLEHSNASYAIVSVIIEDAQTVRITGVINK